MDDETDPYLWTVDRGWGRVPSNSEGEPYYETKLHIDRGDSTAKCSRRIFLNSLPLARGVITADAPAGRVSDFEDDLNLRTLICRRCVPTPDHMIGAKGA